MPGTGPRSALSSLFQSSLIPFAAALLFATAALAHEGQTHANAKAAAAHARALDAQNMTLNLVGLSRRLENARTVETWREMVEPNEE